MKDTFRKPALFLLCLVMLVSLTAAAAFAEQGENPAGAEGSGTYVSGTVEIGDPAGESNNNYELLTEYARKRLEEAVDPGVGAAATTYAREKLEKTNPTMAKIFTAILPEIQAISAGEEGHSSTVISVPLSELDFKRVYTAAELGVTSITSQNHAASFAKAKELAGLTATGVGLLRDTLVSDCAYELYWFDKTVGFPYNLGSYSYGSSTLTLTGNFEISLPVAAEYSAGEFLVSTAKINSFGINDAIEHAQWIANQTSYHDRDDWAKLNYYRQQICELTDYNDEAADVNYDGGYGNPWQLIWVFDRNPDTKVVCEGYSKAFAYLCELTNAQEEGGFEDVECYLASGMMTCDTQNGTSGGPHMWNIVRMGGKNYLVDVTNCDGDSIGAPDQLFMTGYDSVSEEGAYVVACDSGDVHYTYGELTQNAYRADQLSIVSKATLTAPTEDRTVTLTINGDAESATALSHERVTLLVRAPGATGLRVWNPYGNGGGSWDYYDRNNALSYLELQRNYGSDVTLFAQACYNNYDEWIGDPGVGQWTTLSNEVQITVPAPTETLATPAAALEATTVSRSDWLHATITQTQEKGEWYWADVYKKIDNSEYYQSMDNERYSFNSNNELYIPAVHFDMGQYMLRVIADAPGYNSSERKALLFTVTDVTEVPTGLLRSDDNSPVYVDTDFTVCGYVPGAEYMRLRVTMPNNPDRNDWANWRDGDGEYNRWDLSYGEPGTYELKLTAKAQGEVIGTYTKTITVSAEGTRLASPDLSVFPGVLGDGQGLFGMVGVDGRAARMDIHVYYCPDNQPWTTIYDSDRERAGAEWTESERTVNLPADLFTQPGVYRFEAYVHAPGIGGNGTQFCFLREDGTALTGGVQLMVNDSTDDIDNWYSSSDLNVTVSAPDEATAVRLLKEGEWEYEDLKSGTASWYFGCGDGDYVLVAQMTTADPVWREEGFDWGEFRWQDLEWTSFSNAVRVHVSSPYGVFEKPQLTANLTDGKLTRGDFLTVLAAYQPVEGVDREWIWADLFFQDTSDPDHSYWRRLENYCEGTLSLKIPTIQLEPGNYMLKVGIDAVGCRSVEDYLGFEIVEPAEALPDVALFFSRDNNTMQANQGVIVYGWAKDASWQELEISWDRDSGWHDGRGAGGGLASWDWGCGNSGTYTFTLRAYYPNDSDPVTVVKVVKELTVTSSGELEAPVLKGVPGVLRVNPDKNYDISFAAIQGAQWYNIQLNRQSRNGDWTQIYWDRNDAAANETTIAFTLDKSLFGEPGEYQLQVSAAAVGFDHGYTEVWFPVLAGTAAGDLSLAVSGEHYGTQEDEYLLYQNVTATLTAPEGSGITAAQAWNGRGWSWMDPVQPEEGQTEEIWSCGFGLDNDGAFSCVVRATTDASIEQWDREHNGNFNDFDWSEVEWELTTNPYPVNVVCYGTMLAPTVDLDDENGEVLRGEQLSFSYTEVDHAWSYGVYVMPKGGTRSNILYEDECVLEEENGRFSIPTMALEAGEYDLILNPRCFGWRGTDSRTSFTVLENSEAGIFEIFRNLCESADHPDYYGDLRDFGELTILEDMTIPEGMHVEAWGTTFVIPDNSRDTEDLDGVQLTIEGSAGCTGFRTEGKGELILADNFGANVNVNTVSGPAGSVYVGDRSNFGVDVDGWDPDTMAPIFLFSEKDAYVWVNSYVNDSSQMESSHTALVNAEIPDAINYGKNFTITFPWALTDSSFLQPGINYHVNNNGEDEQGLLTIPPDADVTLVNETFISLHGTDLIVYGALTNNGTIELKRGDGGNWANTANLVIVNDEDHTGSYSGDGMIRIESGDDPKNHLVGIDRRRILSVWDDENNDWSAWRIAPAGGLQEILDGMAGSEDRYDLWDELVIGDGEELEELTIPAKVQFYVHAPLTVENGGTLVNESDLYLEPGGSLVVEQGGSLEMEDAEEPVSETERWVAAIILDGGTMDVSADTDTVTYDEYSTVEVLCWSYNDDVDEALAAAKGVPADRMDVALNVRSADELFGLNGNERNYWIELKDYVVTFNLNKGLNLSLPIEEIPENYMLILNDGASVTNPAENTLALNGGIVLEGGTLDNSGTLNVNNWINFQRCGSFFVNNGILNVSGWNDDLETSGWIEANSWHLDEEGENGTGTITNNGSVFILEGGTVAQEVSIDNNIVQIDTRLVLPAFLTEIEDEAFAGTDVQAVDLPETIQRIGESAFAGCEGLRVVTIPVADVDFIDPTAFTGCDNLTIVAPAGGTVQAYVQSAQAAGGSIRFAPVI